MVQSHVGLHEISGTEKCSVLTGSTQTALLHTVLDMGPILNPIQNVTEPLTLLGLDPTGCWAKGDDP